MAVDLAGDEPFDAAHDVLPGHAFGGSAGDVLTRALVVERPWDEADWAELEEKAHSVTRAGCWIDQRDAEGTDLLELLDAAGENDRGTENPFR